MAATVRLAEEKPELVLFNEIVLDKSTGDNQVKLGGYTFTARRDRSDNSGWGGTAVFAKENLENRMVELHIQAPKNACGWHHAQTEDPTEWDLGTGRQTRETLKGSIH